MQIEQSMYQTSNQALKLAMNAQTQELQHVRDHQEKGHADVIEQQLKEFDDMANDYKETVELPSVEERKEANWFA